MAACLAAMRRAQRHVPRKWVLLMPRVADLGECVDQGALVVNLERTLRSIAVPEGGN